MLKLTNLPDFDRQLRQQWADQLNKQFRKAKPEIIKQVRSLVSKKIRESPEYKSLSGGLLSGEMGIKKGTERDKLITIVNKMIDTTKVELQKATLTRNGIKMQLIIESADTESLEGIPEGVEQSTSGPWEWLRWLLYEGNKTIVNWDVADANTFELAKDYSRSHSKIMKKGRGRRWSTPSQFAGTSKSNWFTRALVNTEDELAKIIVDAINK